MKLGIHLAIISLCFTGLARAQLELPRIVIKEENRSLDLVELAIEVNIDGNLAETILDLEYFNSGRRNAEGEFTLQLPPGATVSTYALEVNGEMRPGVSVEKEQARFAYESIKARNIDPGLVEREADNVYRTRIFPIFGNKTKRVRVGFIHPIPEGKYIFPLNAGQKVKTFSCFVSGQLAKAPILVLSHKPREPGEAFKNFTWAFNDIKPEGSLKLEARLPREKKYQTNFNLDDEGNLYFITQGKIAPEEARISREDWKSIRLIWDISHSGNWRNHDAEFAALKKVIQFAGECTIKAHFLNETLLPAKTFKIRDGNADALITYLRTPLYQGNADFSKIPPQRGNTLLFSDGSAALPKWALPELKAGNSIYLLHSDSSRISPAVAGNASHLLDINSPQFKKDFEERTPFVRSTNLPRDLWDFSMTGDYFTLSGKVPREMIKNASMSFRSEEAVPFPRNANATNKTEWSFTRRVWAARRLASLETIDDPGIITSFAIKERLVSDYTSLIVLEQFSDHLRYNIPPPEPDLLTRYEQEKRKEGTLPIQSVADAWLEKKKWHISPFPWFDTDLQEQVEFVRIWTRSSRAAFPKKKLNSKPIREYEAWNLNAKKTIQKRDQVESGKQFKNWIKELDQRITDIHRIRSRKPKEDPAGKIHVSLRGAVKERGIFSEPSTTTLQQVIREAGGTTEYRNMSRVFLYRDATRTGYNLLNRATKPIPLQWGDMIVVESLPPKSINFGDPFSAPVDPFFGPPQQPRRSEGAELRNAPAVFETAGSLRPQRNTGQPNEFPKEKTGQSRVESGFPAKPRGEAFFTKLKSHPDPWEFYESDVRSMGGLSVKDTIKAARFFFQQSDTDRGTRILSNLFELLSNPIEAVRSYAYWITEFGNPDEGRRVLNEMLSTPHLDHQTRALLHFDIGQITNQADPFRKSIAEELKSKKPTNLATIALNDAFNREKKAVQKITPYQMTSDYRVVVTSMGQQYHLSVKIPERFRGMMNDESARQLSSSGVTEHQSIKALPGIAEVELSRADPGTYHIVIYRKFGSPQQKVTTRKTIYLEEGPAKKLGEIDFGWDDISVDFEHLPVKGIDPFEER